MISSNSTSIERKLKKIIPNKIKIKIIDIVTNKHTGWLIKKIFKTTILGAKFDFTLVDNKTAVKIFFAIWESAEIRLSKKYVNDNDNIIELGSSIGVMMATLMSNKKFKKYIAVEASNKANDVLSKTIQNYPPNKIIHIKSAIDYNGKEEIDFVEQTLNNSKSLSSFSSENFVTTSYKIKTITLNRLANEYINEGEDYVLLSDIEGAEAQIFEQDKEALTKCKLIICELEHTKTHTIEKQISLLLSNGFEIQEYYGNVYVFQKIK